MFMKSVASLIPAVAAFCLTTTQPLFAETHALMVGVSGCTTGRQLSGPPNDVALMHSVLVGRGVAPENITVLADKLPEWATGVRAAGLTIRALIIEALERLVERVRPGDAVQILFSGHGSQQPEPPGRSEEPDQLDEIFLPLDVGPWEESQASVRNAIIDNEIADFVRRMRQKGAFVWIIFDTCHSATMTRGGGESDVVTRSVDPALLGVPIRARTQPTTLADGAAGRDVDFDGELPGGLVAFFASQPDQLAKEFLHPVDLQAEGRRLHGALTYNLATALLQHPGATYRELAVAILAGYDRSNLEMTPYFEGELDRSVSGSTGENTARQVHARQIADERRWELSAGLLHGLNVGSELRFRLPSDLSAAPVATGFVESVDLNRAVVAIRAAPGIFLPRQLLGEVTNTIIPLRLSITEPFSADGNQETLAHARAALDRILASPAVRDGVAIDLAAPGEPTDVRLRIEAGRIWILNGAGDWPRDQTSRRFRTIPSVRIGESVEVTARELGGAVAAINRARNLARIASHLSAARDSALLVSSHIARDEQIATPQQPVTDKRDCAPVPSSPEVPTSALAVAAIETSRIYHCDVVYLSIQNSGEHPLDLTVLHVDEVGCISYLKRISEDPRLHPNQPARVVPVLFRTWNLRRNEPSSTGLERFIVIGVERRTANELYTPFTFDFLAGSCAERRVPPVRSVNAAVSASDRTIDALFDIGVGRNGLRTSSAPTAMLSRAHVAMLRFDVRAPE